MQEQFINQNISQFTKASFWSNMKSFFTYINIGYFLVFCNIAIFIIFLYIALKNKKRYSAIEFIQLFFMVLLFFVTMKMQLTYFSIIFLVLCSSILIIRRVITHKLKGENDKSKSV